MGNEAADENRTVRRKAKDSVFTKNWKKSAVYAIIEVDKANRGCGKK